MLAAPQTAAERTNFDISYPANTQLHLTHQCYLLAQVIILIQNQINRNQSFAFLGLVKELTLVILLITFELNCAN